MLTLLFINIIIYLIKINYYTFIISIYFVFIVFIIIFLCKPKILSDNAAKGNFKQVITCLI